MDLFELNFLLIVKCSPSLWIYYTCKSASHEVCWLLWFKLWSLSAVIVPSSVAFWHSRYWLHRWNPYCGYFNHLEITALCNNYKIIIKLVLQHWAGQYPDIKSWISPKPAHTTCPSALPMGQETLPLRKPKWLLSLSVRLTKHEKNKSTTN